MVCMNRSCTQANKGNEGEWLTAENAKNTEVVLTGLTGWTDSNRVDNHLRIGGNLRLLFQWCHRVDEEPAKGAQEIDGGKHPEIGVPVVMGGFEHERDNHGRQGPTGIAHHVHAPGK